MVLAPEHPLVDAIVPGSWPQGTDERWTGGAATPADAAPVGMPGEEHLRVQRLLTRMAAAEPHHYVVVEAEGTPDEVAARVLAGVEPMLPPVVDTPSEVPT